MYINARYTLITTFCFRRCKGSARVVCLLIKHQAKRFSDYEGAIGIIRTTPDLEFISVRMRRLRQEMCLTGSLLGTV